MRNIGDNSSSAIAVFNEVDSGFKFRKHGTWCELIVIHVFLCIFYGNCTEVFFIVLTKVEADFLHTGKDQKRICV